MRCFNKDKLAVFIILFSLTSFAWASVLQPMTDSVNSGVLNTKIATDSALTNINVDATVENGIVIYKGDVQSKAQYDELMRIAHSISGIKGVNVTGLKITK